MKKEICIRSQHAKRRGRNSGPDTYVAVMVIPDGVEAPKYLNQRVCSLRGIDIKYFGEGYSRHFGPRSALGRAIKAAKDFAAS